MTDERTAGQLLDDLGVTLTLEPGQVVSAATVITTVVDMESGREFIVLGVSDGCGAFTQLGMVASAHDVVRGLTGYGEDDD